MQAEDDTPYYKAVDKLYKSALTHISRARFQLCLAQKYFHLGVCHHTVNNMNVFNAGEASEVDNAHDLWLVRLPFKAPLHH